MAVKDWRVVFSVCKAGLPERLTCSIVAPCPWGSGKMMLTGKDKATIFSPLLAYLLYLSYLAFFSSRPFFFRWVEGCFGLFVALVFCNLIRRGLIEDGGEEEPEDDGTARTDEGDQPPSSPPLRR